MVEFNTGNNTYEEGNYILVNHKYYTEGHEQQLTPKEMYILITLRKMISTYYQKTLISFSGLSQLISFTNHKQQSKNAEIVKHLLESLRDKDIISYVDPNNAHDLIEIEIEQVKYIDGDKSTAYQPVGEEILNLTSDPVELYILLVVRRFNLMDKAGEFEYPFYRNKKNWGSILLCDDRTALKKVNKMISNKLLYWYENTKEYDKENEKWKQDCGLYFIYPSPVHEKRIAERDLKREEYRKRKQDTSQIVPEDKQDTEWMLELLNEEYGQDKQSWGSPDKLKSERKEVVHPF
ncbi:hypothetical protein [Brevibacillus centrosporus]|jgi:hypothetical protein|uniref:hypothetical protein n=1 Tax=Brevibacillus centrosporus TaxID=54910 RepID=UPI002E24EDCD|nr:hypothetical protein [Brevibacillus centrosporus]